MATIERLVKTKQLKTNRLSAALAREQSPYLFYDRESDDLLLQFVPFEVMTVVHYTDDEHVALLYVPESMEIVGLQVEAFVTRFLPLHASVERAWRLGNSGIELKDVEDLIIVFQERKQEVAREMISYAEPWLEQLFRPDNAAQPSLAPA